jgi:L-serine deaminase
MVGVSTAMAQAAVTVIREAAPHEIRNEAETWMKAPFWSSSVTVTVS